VFVIFLQSIFLYFDDLGFVSLFLFSFNDENSRAEVQHSLCYLLFFYRACVYFTEITGLLMLIIYI